MIPYWIALFLIPLKLFAGDFFVVLLVEAPHLNLSTNRACLKTMAKHPSNWSKNGDVGHAWIYLQGGGLCIEGGHSGELGITQLTYFQGVMQKHDQGDPNPAAYLWSTLDDGFFQRGSGGHRPTYAVALPLNQQQFDAILNLLETYDFSHYSLARQQCCSFVTQVAALVGLELDAQEILVLESTLTVAKEEICLWQDPTFSQLPFESPDRLEQSLRRAVLEGKATPALDWYNRHVAEGESLGRTLRLFPKRLCRYLAL